MKNHFASPLRYPGGKTKMATFINDLLERNFSNKKIILVEPYAGGAGASLKLLFNNKVDKIIINDYDKSIYAFWKIVTTDPDFFIRKIKKVNITLEERAKQKAIYHNPKSKQKDVAFAVFFLSRVNYSGIINAGVAGGKNQNGALNIKSRFKKDVLIKRIKMIKQYKNKIRVYNLDGLELLRKLDVNKNKKDFFIFIDPPYYKKGQSLYLNYYNDAEHIKLSNFLKKLKLKWILTYDDCEFIKNLYRNMKQYQFIIPHTARKAGMGKEIAIFPEHIVSCY